MMRVIAVLCAAAAVCAADNRLSSPGFPPSSVDAKQLRELRLRLDS